MWTYLQGGLTNVGQHGLRIAAIILERLYKREHIGDKMRLWRETRRGFSRWSEAGRSRLLVTILSTWWMKMSFHIDRIAVSLFFYIFVEFDKY